MARLKPVVRGEDEAVDMGSSDEDEEDAAGGGKDADADAAAPARAAAASSSSSRSPASAAEVWPCPCRGERLPAGPCTYAPKYRAYVKKHLIKLHGKSEREATALSAGATKIRLGGGAGNDDDDDDNDDDDDEVEGGDDERCEVCEGAEDAASMLLCDGCDAGFHLHCLDPPLAAVPDGEWRCPRCAGGAGAGAGADHGSGRAAVASSSSSSSAHGAGRAAMASSSSSSSAADEDEDELENEFEAELADEEAWSDDFLGE
jgi:hypothetical protein